MDDSDALLERSGCTDRIDTDDPSQPPFRIALVPALLGSEAFGIQRPALGEGVVVADGELALEVFLPALRAFPAGGGLAAAGAFALEQRFGFGAEFHRRVRF